MAGTAEIGMSPVGSAPGRDVPDTRLRAIVATPSGSTADQASPRRQRQHFRVRDPLQPSEGDRFWHSALVLRQPLQCPGSVLVSKFENGLCDSDLVLCGI